MSVYEHPEGLTDGIGRRTQQGRLSLSRVVLVENDQEINVRAWIVIPPCPGPEHPNASESLAEQLLVACYRFSDSSLYHVFGGGGGSYVITSYPASSIREV